MTTPLIRSNTARALAGLLLFAFIARPPIVAAGEAEIADILARDIMPPALATAEVRAFAAARIVRMPEVQTEAEWAVLSDAYRAQILAGVVFRGEAARWRDAPSQVQWLDDIAVPADAGYRLRQLRYEAVPGLWIPAVVYEPTALSDRTPVFLGVHGHAPLGKAAGFKQELCINLAKRGLIVMNVEWVGTGQLDTDGNNHLRANQLDLCGTSGLAVHYLALSRALDILLAHAHADPKRVAVAGLSGGGWQTLFFSALDPRVTLANPVAGYSSFLTRIEHASDLGDSEQMPVDLAATADYAILTAMLAPRAVLLTYNQNDNCCFGAPYALPPLVAAAEPVFKRGGQPGRFRTHVNEDPGTHNFSQDNRQAFYRMLGDQFFPDRDDFPTEEIDCRSELKSFDELKVPMPATNADFHTLAMALARALPRAAALPREAAAVAAWQADKRQELARVVRFQSYHVEPNPLSQGRESGVQTTRWQLRLSDTWTVPAVELTPAHASATTLVVADAGRKSAAAQIDQLLAAGHRVLAIDPFILGESEIHAWWAFKYPLLVSSCGERPLGVQASQVAAIAGWLGERAGGPVDVAAYGPRASLFALVAAGLAPAHIGAVRLHNALGSLHEILERNLTVGDAPECFTFGLLESFDVNLLAALVAPRRVSFVDPSERVKTELGGLAEFYRLLGTAFDPMGPARTETDAAARR